MKPWLFFLVVLATVLAVVGVGFLLGIQNVENSIITVSNYIPGRRNHHRIEKGICQPEGFTHASRCTHASCQIVFAAHNIVIDGIDGFDICAVAREGCHIGYAGIHVSGPYGMAPCFGLFRNGFVTLRIACPVGCTATVVEHKAGFVQIFLLTGEAVKTGQGHFGYLMAALMHHYDGLYHRLAEQQQAKRSREQTIFDRFLYLVNRHATHQRQIDFYASQMCLTGRYLGTVVSQASNVTAKEWIDRALILRIKVELKHTDKTIAQIADDMHFPNPSFFCKYFRRLTGTTPTEYRRA